MHLEPRIAVETQAAGGLQALLEISLDDLRRLMLLVVSHALATSD